LNDIFSLVPAPQDMLIAWSSSNLQHGIH
jgi:hypothetical protein